MMRCKNSLVTLWLSILEERHEVQHQLICTVWGQASLCICSHATHSRAGGNVEAYTNINLPCCHSRKLNQRTASELVIIAIRLPVTLYFIAALDPEIVAPHRCGLITRYNTFSLLPLPASCYGQPSWRCWVSQFFGAGCQTFYGFGTSKSQCSFVRMPRRQ